MKIKILLLLISVIHFMSCHRPAKINQKRTDTLEELNPLDQHQLTITEFIYWDSVKVNNLVSMISTKDKVHSILGKPDSIFKDDDLTCGTFFYQHFEWIYIKGAVFESKGDTMIFKGLSLKKSNLRLVTKGITLDSNTTLTSLNKIFPNAIRQKVVMINKRTKERFISITVGTTPNNVQADYGVWELLFKNEKLVEITHSSGC